MFWFFVGMLIVGVALLCTGHLFVGLVLTILAALVIAAFIGLVIAGLIALASDHPDVRRRR